VAALASPRKVTLDPRLLLAVFIILAVLLVILAVLVGLLILLYVSSHKKAAPQKERL
jgi:flagellar basal body-associated protein FliL